MCGCKLKIETESGGETALFEADGVFEIIEEGERVCYPIEGDDGELLFSEAFFKTCRRGRCPLEASFFEGQESEFMIGTSDLTGKIPVRTTHYLLQKEEAGRRIELCYDLSGSKNIQTFSLKIQIVFFSEEK